MDRSLSPASGARLEGLCERIGTAPHRRRIRFGRAADGIERLEAQFTGQAFVPHRHDTYAIGVTLAGVQTFRYRGATRRCLPGEWHVLHPDETHDGAAGTESGFAYRILYVDPSLVQRALGGRPLPFVPDPVVRRNGRTAALASWLRDLDDPIDELGRTEFALDVADLLAALVAGPASAAAPRRGLALPALLQVRDLIAEDPAIRHPLATLERVAGLDRWTLARQFRAAFGTSPSRFRIMRQLDRARRLVTCGASLAEAALAAGFADQSHMSRQFKRTYGQTPGRWQQALAAPGAEGAGRGEPRPSLTPLQPAAR